MRRIATANRYVDLHGPGKDGFRDAVPGVSDPTYLSAKWCNDVQESIASAIEQAGLVLSDDPAQLAAAIRAFAELKFSQVAPPAFHAFGGQLRKLREKLSDPLQQLVGVVLLGDSITWGRTLPENAVFDPRNGTLSDPRDNFAAPSWANELKRYIGSQYARSAVPTLSNWAASPSGQAIAEYSVTNLLYPRETSFTYAFSGASLSVVEVASSAIASTGYQLQLSDGNAAGTSYHSISFPFTGTEFTLLYACVDLDHCDYEIIVDGVSQGVFPTSVVGGGVDGTNENRRTHTFGYVRDKVIEIRSKRPDGSTGTRRLRLNAVEVTKTIRITNQGINGATTRTYDLYNLSGAYSNPTAVTAQDNFIIMQLGTNDRIKRADVPHGVQGFRRHLTTIMSRLIPLGDVICMAANPSSNEDPATYTFTMQEVRGVLMQEAKLRSVDFIDNYSIFQGVNLSEFTADGLHPNAGGMQRITKNILTSLEQA